MMRKDLKQAEKYVSETPGAYWDGWDMMLHKPRPAAEYNSKGVRHPVTKQWGFVTRVAPNSKGAYEIRV